MRVFRKFVSRAIEYLFETRSCYVHHDPLHACKSDLGGCRATSARKQSDHEKNEENKKEYFCNGCRRSSDNNESQDVCERPDQSGL